MMNVLEMIAGLETEIKDLKEQKETKERIIEKYERELGPLKIEVKDISDTLDNLQMALESLNLCCVEPKSNVNVVHEDEVKKESPLESDPPKFTESGLLIGAPERKNTRPKGVYKKDAHGNIIGEYRSISEAARENKFDTSSLRNLILKVSKDKQIRQRGHYYVYK